MIKIEDLHKMGFDIEQNVLNYNILDSMADWVRVVDKNGIVVFANDAMKKALGEAIVGIECYKAYCKEDSCTFCIANRTILTGETMQKEEIITREELAAYRKPLEEQVLSLMKERRTLYRKEPGGMRIQEINGELKELRKKIRLSQQIEIQSKEMEERLKQAKEQEQIQESSGKQRREEERKR